MTDRAKQPGRVVDDQRSTPASDRERKQPTHKLVIEIPLNVNATVPLNYDATKQALELALAVSRAGVDHVICDDIEVHLLDVELR